MELMWTLSSAQTFLLEVHDMFDALGLRLSIVGSVAVIGKSAKDLDVLVEPLAGVHVTLEDALTRVCEEFLLEYTVDTIQTLNPLPTREPEDQIFVNLGLRDGRTIELFFPERLFPFEAEMRHANPVVAIPNVATMRP
jgi:hypothetical protein